MAQHAFAPYRLPPGVLPEEAARLAADVGAEPLLVPLDEPLPGGLSERSMALVPAGSAGQADEACRSADGSPSVFGGDLRACLVSERHLTRVSRAAALALELGFAGVCLDRPDAPLALGILGAGFCPDCQRAFSRELAREYGDHFQPIDILKLAREALAQSSGALGYEALPFGREFWRMRLGSLERAVQGYARAARDAARAHGKPFEVAALFEAVGPAQLRAARHLDMALYPAQPQQLATGAGMFRLLRTAMGRRPVAAAIAETGPALARISAVAAACGVEVVPELPTRPTDPLGAIRRFARAQSERRQVHAKAVAECAVLYSSECDAWTAGSHREQVERAGEALAQLHVQAPVVMRIQDAPPGAVIVLAGATALSPQEAREAHRRVDGGGMLLAIGPVGAVDEAGRKVDAPLPTAKSGGTRLGKGMMSQVPALAPLRPGQLVDEKQLEPVSRALSAVLGRRRAAGISGRSPMLVFLEQDGERLDAHIVALTSEPAQGMTLFLSQQYAGNARRARFQSADGDDQKIVMNPSGTALSTVLPSFSGYAVLSVPG
ncbi:MAG TPA: hypothetical protein VFK85_14695 [Anaeromyxobacteraceae bacterium]|nr:hypothetical protein [Anaeromyxobacteraceae bacterium]